ncbi:FxsA family protein [Defluviimonas aestuarii]|uniref:FxsA family protein n=1 Tax=Albidovulum aestuarii TaxID=1130726 RepID=UPI00249CC7AA|nr:FxsA family protein [Defluviimonas aestuarii]MDI3337831.1 FxsA family protein [Defluviimonas aestuarii]
MWLLIAFIAVPMIEIALFIQVGGFIGLWWTLAIVLATAVAGSLLVRMQGALALAQLRGSLQELRDPTEPIAHGALILFAGALLLTPGFFTDTVGLLLLVPAVRSSVLRYLASRVRVERFNVGGMPPRREQHRPDVIDGDFVEIDPDNDPRPPSGWTRH